MKNCNDGIYNTKCPKASMSRNKSNKRCARSPHRKSLNLTETREKDQKGHTALRGQKTLNSKDAISPQIHLRFNAIPIKIPLVQSEIHKLILHLIGNAKGQELSVQS